MWRYMAESNGFAHSVLKHSSPLLCIIQIKCDSALYVGYRQPLNGWKVHAAFAS